MEHEITTLRVSEVVTLTGRCGVPYEERALRYALRGIGVEPSRTEVNKTTGKGRIKFYDGLVPLVVASASRSPRGRALKDLDRPLDEFREIAKRVIGADAPAMVERMANYLFIASPTWGMDIPVLADMLHREPSTVDLVPEDGDLLLRVLSEYQRLRAEWERTMPLARSKVTEPERTVSFAGEISALVVSALMPSEDVQSATAEIEGPTVEGERFSIAEFYSDDDEQSPATPPEPPVSR